MSLNDIVGKHVAATACERDSPMGLTYAAQITFGDGSTLDINIEARYCHDAWLVFEHSGGVELSAETKAELDGLS